MMVKLVPILHSSAVDLSGHAAHVKNRAGFDGQPPAALTDFGRALSGRGDRSPRGVNAEFVFDAAKDSSSAPVIVVGPLDCQSSPRTQPNA
jgi:hypothetical protein